jgi:uncharacterized cupredoxin-like copper-binding protein
MARKKRRRGAQKQRTEEQQTTDAQPQDGGDDEAARAERRAKQKREWAQQKRKQERAGGTSPFIWGGGIAAVVAIALVGGFLLFAGGGGDDDSGPTATPRPDSRIAGLPIDQTITVNMNDSGQNVNPRYEPNQIEGEAGQVIEIITPNIGSVFHNLRFAGINGEYEAGDPSSDDWVTFPESVDPGEQGRVVVKFDEPGTYQFKCDFHPTQIGTLVVR